MKQIKPSGQCCKDYEKSRLRRCDSCHNHRQVMPSLGLCQDCTCGEALDPSGTEVWKVHSLDCYKLRRRHQITRSN